MAVGARSQVLRESDLLSALGRPYQGYHESIYEKAAALVHAIIFNHAFFDGNKRTALYLVELLLKKSGYKLLGSDSEIYRKFCLVAAGKLSYEGLREWLEGIIVSSDDEAI